MDEYMARTKSSTSHIASPDIALVFFNTSPTIIIIDFSAFPCKNRAPPQQCHKKNPENCKIASSITATFAESINPLSIAAQCLGFRVALQLGCAISHLVHAGFHT